MAELVLTRDQVRRVDERAFSDYAMPGLILMENAGRNAAQIIRERFGHLAGKRVAIVCGPGNNGGDGYVIARHLHNVGWDVRIVLALDPARLKGDARINFRIIEAMRLPQVPAAEALAWCELVVDALLGTGFSGEVRPPLDDLIDRINAAGKPVVAVDVPSGLDCQTGRPAGHVVRASVTVTFVAVKAGFLQPEARPFVGDVVPADIGVPVELIRAAAAE